MTKTRSGHWHSGCNDLRQLDSTSGLSTVAIAKAEDPAEWRMNLFKRNAIKVFMFISAAYSCIHPLPGAAATSDPGHHSKCLMKYKDPEQTIYHGGSFTEDCSTVSILPLRRDSIETVEVQTSNSQLCEDYDLESAQMNSYLKGFNEAFDEEMKLTKRWMEAIAAKSSSSTAKIIQDKVNAQKQKVGHYVEKMEQLQKHRLHLASLPVMRAHFNVRSTAAVGHDVLTKANPGLNVVSAKVWDLEILHSAIGKDLESMPSLIGVRGPTESITQDLYEKDGIPVELMLSRSGACGYYDKVTKTFDLKKAAMHLKEHFPINLQFKVKWDGEVKTMIRPVSNPAASAEQDDQMIILPWISGASTN